MGVDITVKVLESQKQLEKALAQEIAKELNARVPKAMAGINTKVRKLIQKTLTDTPAYRSIVNGQLKKEFGIPDGGYKMDTLITAWANSVTTKFKQFTVVGQQLRSGLLLYAVKSDFSDALASPEAIQTTKKGGVLPWLEWMLDTAASGGTILGYRLGMGKGRAGPVVMIQSRTQSWEVPEEFTGTLSDNFVTQALDSIQPAIEQIITTEITSKL